MSEVTLYWNIISQPARAVKCLLDIGKVPHKLVSVDVVRQENRTKEFLEMYPVGKIPVLKAGDFVLGESGAIMIYLCEQHPHLAPYYGGTLQQRATTNQFVSWYQNFYRPFLLAPVRLLLTALIAGRPVLARHQQTLEQGLVDALGKFNDLLAGSRTKFVAGDRLTIADLLFYFETTNLVYLGMELDKYPEAKRWYADVYAVPEVKALTHEWYQVAKHLTKKLQAVEVKPKL